MNEMRERLIETIYENSYHKKCDLCTSDCPSCAYIVKLADTLIEAGVILPKFKIGQEVFVNRFEYVQKKFRTERCFVDKRIESQKGLIYDLLLRRIGQHAKYEEQEIYATEAEAREALAAMKEGEK